MFNQEWSSKVVIRYSLLQLPGIALLIGILFFFKRWVDIPLWAMWFIPIVWVLKDIILFPFVWRAYDWDQKEGGKAMIGMRGIVTERLDPEGYILVRGELWRAETMRSDIPVEKGQEVSVYDIKGLVLQVKPVDKKNIIP
jgi:membrane protein implicated in regulation of membrane protease activity